MNETAIFAEAVKLTDAAARAAYLAAACGNNAGLLREIEELLRQHETGQGFLEEPAPLPSATVTRPGTVPAPAGPAGSTAGVGTVVAGRYKLLEAIGEGGMGSVYMAQQTEPVKRLVALKLIKAGMASKTVLGRFEMERQALAVMDHPNIAKVLDAGAAESGQPFFIMELVKGVPITQFCDDRRLTTRERLELFIPVCQAIQHAHQKGIIHRDIKPSNVLVAMYDEKPVPKVIDFGIAKAVGEQIDGESVVTGFGAVVGTLAYMSPEQAQTNQLDIDTRSDVYALGVLLYEMLTGSPPLEKSRFQQAALLEILRLVREEEPPRPSSRLSSSEALPSIAANRNTEPARLARLLRGDLDWIALKALDKDRARRYETASGLAQDIRRHLDDEAVEARPASAVYRLRKLVKRQRAAFVAGSMVLLAIFLGAGVSVWQAKRAMAERDEKELARRGEAEQKEAVQKRVVQLQKLDGILLSLFRDLDPTVDDAEGRPIKVVLGERLDKATEQIEGETVGDPLIAADMQVQLGQTQCSLGYPQKAIGLLAKAAKTYEALLGPKDIQTLAAVASLAEAYRREDRVEEALPLLLRNFEIAKAEFGIQDLTTMNAVNSLATCYESTGKPALAAAMHEGLLRQQEAVLGIKHRATLLTMNNLAVSYQKADKVDLAISLLRKTFELLKETLGPRDDLTLSTMNNLATAYEAATDYRSALAILEQLYEIQRVRLGPEHRDTLMVMGNLAPGMQVRRPRRTGRATRGKDVGTPQEDVRVKPFRHRYRDGNSIRDLLRCR